MAKENDYPEDEFDRLAKERKVLGAHREVQSKRGWRLAILAIIVIVPLVAWIFVRAGAVDSVTDKVVPPQPSATQTPTEMQEPTPEKTESPTPEETTEAATADMSVEVRVLNGSGISGLAAKKETALKDAGFTDTVADNYNGGSVPSQSTIYYAEEKDEATAQKVASTLGISQVELSPQYVSGGQGIVVVLRSDAA